MGALISTRSSPLAGRCRSLQNLSLFQPKNALPLPYFARHHSDIPNANIHPDLKVLSDLNQIHLDQTRTLHGGKKLEQLQMDSTAEIDIKNPNGESLLKVVSVLTDDPRQYRIQVYDAGPEDQRKLVADMDLEPGFKFKAMILRIASPPGQVLSYVHELPGISHVALIEDARKRTLYQVLSNGQFGWSTAAKIMNRSGTKRIGRMYNTNKGVTGGLLGNSMHAIIQCPKEISTPGKLSLIGTCLFLIGRYQ